MKLLAVHRKSTPLKTNYFHIKTNSKFQNKIKEWELYWSRSSGTLAGDRSLDPEPPKAGPGWSAGCQGGANLSKEGTEACEWDHRLQTLAVSSTPQAGLTHPKNAGSSGLKAREETPGLRLPEMAFPTAVCFSWDSGPLQTGPWASLFWYDWGFFWGRGCRGRGKKVKRQAPWHRFATQIYCPGTQLCGPRTPVGRETVLPPCGHF